MPACSGLGAPPFLCVRFAGLFPAFDLIFSRAYNLSPPLIWLSACRVQEARSERRDADEVRNHVFDLFRESPMWGLKVISSRPLLHCSGAGAALTMSLGTERGCRRRHRTGLFRHQCRPL